MANRSLLSAWRLRWNRQLMRFLRQRTHTSIDVEDLAQETYLRLLRARDLSDVRNTQAYLLTVASHVVSEWLQRQPPPGTIEDIYEALLVDERTPELQVGIRISQQRLDDALAALSPMMRAVLVLRTRDELPNKEIARRLELTDRQVKRYLARGYERLRAALEPEKEFP